MAKETKFVLVNGTVKEVRVSTKRARLIGRLPKDLTYRITRVYCTSLATNALNGKSNDVSSEAVMVCENCGKHILNIAVVQASDGKNFNVAGMDATLAEVLDLNTYNYMTTVLPGFGDAQCGYYPPSLGWSGGFGITGGEFEFDVETFTRGKGEFYYLPIAGSWCLSDGAPHHGFIPSSGEIECCEKSDLVNGVCGPQ